MPTLIFKLNKDRDIRNAWELCNTSSPWAEPVEKNLLKQIIKVY